MIFVLQLFTLLVGAFVIAVVAIPLAAIWETMRANRDFEKIARERRQQMKKGGD
jgi:hypothetical protein